MLVHLYTVLASRLKEKACCLYICREMPCAAGAHMGEAVVLMCLFACIHFYDGAACNLGVLYRIEQFEAMPAGHTKREGRIWCCMA
jgi:hypothetical protein